MITLNNTKTTKISVVLTEEGTTLCPLPGVFSGKYLTVYWNIAPEETTVYLGTGKKEKLDRIKLKELGAKASAEMKEKKIPAWGLDLTLLSEEMLHGKLSDIVEGLILGTYSEPSFKQEKADEYKAEITLFGVEWESSSHIELKHSVHIAEGILFARDITNMPGNFFRPYDFADKVMSFLKDLPVTCEFLSHEKIKELGLNGIEAVGGSSENPPCMLVMHYSGNPDSQEITGLVGKGVTYDTGGYCLKPGSHMDEMRGDMGGGAAVAGTVYALAANNAKTNIVAVIPMCENRISAGSLLPGDIYTSYSGKTVQVLNTDAEGRLILADAVTYAVRDGKATRVVDIATLTGAVVRALGDTIAGIVSDDDAFYQEFSEAGMRSGERVHRLPFYEEHEKMIETPVADIKNMGEDTCGAITAGLFIRAFADQKPWIHFDIAGTSWVNKPRFAFQSTGATGAGLTTLYYLCSKE